MSREGHLISQPLSPERERIVVVIAVVLIVLFRSALFVFRSLNFDSDEAVTGLMAKHLIEGRAFPLFFYGQNYLLGVEAWLAVPLFLVFGISTAALKLPLLLINLAAGLLLVRLFEREVGLRPALALVASLPFLLPAPITASALVSANAGNVEPFLYVLLLWLTRRRPVWFGLILGIGCLHREFTVYGAMALVLVLIVDGHWRSADSWRPLLRGLRVAAEVWLVVQVLRPFASASGPGTTALDINRALPSNNLLEVFQRICIDLTQLPVGLARLATFHWTELFGLKPAALADSGLESAVTEGLSGSGLVFGVAALVLAGRTLSQLRASRWRPQGFGLYIVLVGLLSAAVYVVGRCGTESPLRYDLLSLFGASGLAAWFFRVEPNAWFRRAGVAVILAWASLSAWPHAQLWGEYVFTSRPPIPAKRLIIQNLDVRGIRYAEADYWIAYYISFLTNERIIVHSNSFVRIEEYKRQVNEHLGQAVRIARRACDDGEQVFEGVYFCPITEPIP